jgi:RecA-family ATPase
LSHIVNGSDYLALPRAPECWLVEGLLPTSGSLLIYGDPKTGKSYAALQLLCCLTSGTEWLGFQVPQAVPAVYIQLDTPRTVWAGRVQELAEAGHPIEGVHFADRETLGTFPFNILNPEHFRLLSTSIADLNPGAVVIDTLRESHSGDENDSTEMQQVIAYLEAAVKPAALILVSHSRKPNPEAGLSLMNDNRGSNYVVGRMDGIVRFTKKSMQVSSRSLEEHNVELERVEEGTWALREGQYHQAIQNVLLDSSLTSIRQKAKVLSERINKPEEACRGMVRRAAQKVKIRKSGTAASQGHVPLGSD